MAKQGEWDGALGIRRDVNLTERWWHRMFKVLYFAFFTLVMVVLGLVIWPELDRDRLPLLTNQIEIITTLGDVLNEADPAVDNVVPKFRAEEGTAGYYEKGSRTVVKISDSDLNDSWCTPDVFKHLDATAAFLNRRDFTDTYNAEGIRASVMKTHKPGDSSRYCWLDTSLQGKDFYQIIKYDFTRFGYAKAVFNYVSRYVFWVFVVHAVILNVYYRGLVYIIVGPRKNQKPLVEDHDKDDDDDDWKEIDEDIDKLTRGSA